MKKLAICITLVMLLSLTETAFAGGGKEDASLYPTKDIQFIVSSSAGGGTDAISRKLCQLMEKDLNGHKFYLVNKPGSADAVGPNLLMGANPDGYTIGSVTYGSVVDSVYQKMIQGYDISKLRFIALVTEESEAIVVRSDLPYKTMDDLIAAAKANPGKIKISDQGIGGRVYIALLKIQEKFGVKFNMISYQNSAAQREALLNKEIDGAMSSLGDYAPIIKSGDVRPLVELSGIRNPTYPDVPTAIDLGWGPDFLFASFYTVACPAGVPADIIAKLTAAAKNAITSQEFTDWTKTAGITAHYLSGQELTDYIKNTQTKAFAALDELKAQGLLK